MKLLWVFVMFLTACGFLSKEEEKTSDAKTSLYKTGEIVLKIAPLKKRYIGFSNTSSRGTFSGWIDPCCYG